MEIVYGMLEGIRVGQIWRWVESMGRGGCLGYLGRLG